MKTTKVIVETGRMVASHLLLLPWVSLLNRNSTILRSKARETDGCSKEICQRLPVGPRHDCQNRDNVGEALRPGNEQGLLQGKLPQREGLGERLRDEGTASGVSSFARFLQEHYRSQRELPERGFGRELPTKFTQVLSALCLSVIQTVEAKKVL